MQLILLILLGGIAGYFIARSKFSQKIDSTTEEVTKKTKELTSKATSWTLNVVPWKKSSNEIIDWVTKGDGSELFPEEFKTWLSGLSEEEAKDFTRSLKVYADSLDLDLSKLSTGELANKPALLQTYVEAVVVYSQAYRKAKEAQEEDEVVTGEVIDPKKDEKDSNKKTAEKQPSRRKAVANS
jgi:hypothetical protein